MSITPAATTTNTTLFGLVQYAKWHEGTVRSFDAERGKHMVHYCDGDKQWCDFQRVPYTVVSSFIRAALRSEEEDATGLLSRYSDVGGGGVGAGHEGRGRDEHVPDTVLEIIGGRNTLDQALRDQVVAELREEMEMADAAAATTNIRSSCEDTLSNEATPAHAGHVGERCNVLWMRKGGEQRVSEGLCGVCTALEYE